MVVCSWPVMSPARHDKGTPAATSGGVWFGLYTLRRLLTTTSPFAFSSENAARRSRVQAVSGFIYKDYIVFNSKSRSRQCQFPGSGWPLRD